MAQSDLITVSKSELQQIVAEAVAMAIGLKKVHVEFEETRLRLTVEQAVEFTGLSKNSIYRLAFTGKLPSETIGRRLFFTPEDLKPFVKRKEVVNG